MRFLADMGISHRSVKYLVQLGHDAVLLFDEALADLPDSHIIEKARAEDRVLLTRRPAGTWRDRQRDGESNPHP